MKNRTSKVIVEKMSSSIFGEKASYDHLKGAAYDASLTTKYFFNKKRTNDGESLFCRTIMLAHGIEKGLSFKALRVPFFEKKLPLFLQLTNQLLKLDPKLSDSRWFMIANALREYDAVHKNEKFYQEYATEITSILSSLTCIKHSSPVKKPPPQKSSYTSYGEFFKQRVSIRNFNDEPVDINLITRAVDLAKYTPSVCNRQPWKIKILSIQKEKEIALGYQNGNKGFGHTADKVIIIGADLRSFVGTIERNECFIDLGMFSMSLILALKEQGLCSCCLNWCVSPRVDKKLHQELNLPEWFRIGYLLAVGYPENGTLTASSPRRNTSDFIL